MSEVSRPTDPRGTKKNIHPKVFYKRQTSVLNTKMCCTVHALKVSKKIECETKDTSNTLKEPLSTTVINVNVQMVADAVFAVFLKFDI